MEEGKIEKLLEVLSEVIIYVMLAEKNKKNKY